MSKPNGTPARYKIGDWVTYPMYPGRAHAQVIELRGPLAPGREQVYRIRHVRDWGEVIEFELTESALEPTDPPEHQPQPVSEDVWTRRPYPEGPTRHAHQPRQAAPESR